MSDLKEGDERADRLRLFAHALSQPLTVFGLAIVSLDRHWGVLRSEEELAAYARDLDGLRRIFERLTSVVAQMRPIEAPLAAGFVAETKT